MKIFTVDNSDRSIRLKQFLSSCNQSYLWMYCRAYNFVWYVDRERHFDCIVGKMLVDIVLIQWALECRRVDDWVWKFHGVFVPRMKWSMLKIIVNEISTRINRCCCNRSETSWCCSSSCCNFSLSSGMISIEDWRRACNWLISSSSSFFALRYVARRSLSCFFSPSYSATRIWTRRRALKRNER